MKPYTTVQTPRNLYTRLASSSPSTLRSTLPFFSPLPSTLPFLLSSSLFFLLFSSVFRFPFSSRSSFPLMFLSPSPFSSSPPSLVPLLTSASLLCCWRDHVPEEKKNSCE